MFLGIYVLRPQQHHCWHHLIKNNGREKGVAIWSTAKRVTPKQMIHTTEHIPWWQFDWRVMYGFISKWYYQFNTMCTKDRSCWIDGSHLIVDTHLGCKTVSCAKWSKSQKYIYFRERNWQGQKKKHQNKCNIPLKTFHGNCLSEENCVFTL